MFPQSPGRRTLLRMLPLVWLAKHIGMRARLWKYKHPQVFVLCWLEKNTGAEPWQGALELVKLFFSRSKSAGSTAKVAFLKKKSFHILFDHVKICGISGA